MAKESTVINASVRKTLAKVAVAELEEKKSVFIAAAAPIANEEQARAFIDEVKRKYHDAKHHVYAYVCGPVSRYSDDGEPQGTGGIPMLNAIKNSGATDMCIVVTRYFGGILLGTGGLSRAYGGAARDAIEKAGIATFEKYSVYRVTCTYSDYQKLGQRLASIGATEENNTFGAEVSADFVIEEKFASRLENTVTEVTAGRAVAVFADTVERASKQN